MKIFSFFLLVSIACLYHPCYAQDTIKVKSLEEAIEKNLNKFRTRILNDKATIYYTVDVKWDKKNINLVKNDFFIENNINPKKIGGKTPKYLLNYLVSINSKQVFISVIQWRLQKKSKKNIEFIDLMTRDYYEIVP